MSTECFRDKDFRPASRALIAQCEEIINRYLDQNLRLTLRQLYYQLVSANVIENKEASYKNLGSLVSDARLAGLLDWDAIEDRVRQPVEWAQWAGPTDLIDQAIRQYRLPRWRGQTKYVELWVEKDALAGVLRPIASDYHVTLMVNRGYSSQSAMYEAANRFNENQRGEGSTLIYVGDHDPSGEDMVRDISDRLAMFRVDDLDVIKVALTMDQIKKHKLPPNPAKMSDSRAEAYVAKHGRSSWEVDALPPEELARLIRKVLEAEVDREVMDAIIAEEKEQKAKLREFAEGLEE